MKEQEPKRLTFEEHRDSLVKTINEKEEYLQILESEIKKEGADQESLVKEINEVKEKLRSLEDRLKEEDKNNI